MLWSKPTNMCILFFHNLYLNIYFTKMQLTLTKVEESSRVFIFWQCPHTLGHPLVLRSQDQVKSGRLDNRDCGQN